LDVGIYNGWIDKSIAKLAGLLPARYAKTEEDSSVIALIQPSKAIKEVVEETPGQPGSGDTGETQRQDQPIESETDETAAVTDEDMPAISALEEISEEPFSQSVQVEE